MHHQGFGFHADICAPGILGLLEPILTRGGLVVELGCGSGRLTQHLVDAGHRVVATDASPDMLALARQSVPAANVRRLVLPDDPIPEADAIVAVGHVLNYLPDERAVQQALIAISQALRPGGVLAIDIGDLEWGRARAAPAIHAQVNDAWTVITRSSVPSPARFVREITVFVRETDGSWRRDDERHDNVLVNTSAIPNFLAAHGVSATARSSFGTEELPAGLRVIVGKR